MGLFARPQVMLHRRAVLQIPPKPPAPHGLPLYKNRYSLTPSESTLPQVLIPLHFISFISNVYKKPGGGTPLPAPKFGNSSLLARYSCARIQAPVHPELIGRWATPFLPSAYSHFRRNGVGASWSANVGQPILAVSHHPSQFSPSTHGSPNSLRISADSASLRYPFPFSVSPPSTFGLLSPSGTPRPDMLSSVGTGFAHQPNPSFRAKRGISLLGPRERSLRAGTHARSKGKWQSAPYL